MHANELLAEKNNEITENNIKLENLNATKDKFFSIIAHDLKNPFNTIMGFTDILIRKGDDIDHIKRDRFIKLIHESTVNIYKLLENLLFWSRSQTGRLKYAPVNLNLLEIINECLNVLKPTANKKDIEIEVNVKEDITIKGDGNMIKTVIRNLVSNAIKYTPKGKITVGTYSQDDNYQVVYIQDNGVGIKSEDIDLIFKVSSVKSKEGTHGEKGTGLGLIICKEFIEKNGGKIWVESDLNKGSVFYFSIPKIDG